ncbi:MAG: ester cyclase [Vicinamibacterales bacterium]
MKRSLTAGVGILMAWMVLDLIAHRLFLAPIYDATASLWRPFDQMNVALIYTVTVVLVGVFVGAYSLLVSPKSLRAGLTLGAFVGLALGISSGFGTFVHMPIPLSLAWGWLIAGWLKGLVAGSIVGAVIVDSSPRIQIRASMSTDSETPNQQTLERAIASWNRGDLTQYLRLYSEDVVLHGYAGLEPGLANVRRFYEAWWEAFPASQLVLEDAVVAGDRVACRFQLTGTHLGTFQGVPSSGRSISVSGFTILRFSGGACVERWSLIDSLGLLTQIGALGGS